MNLVTNICITIFLIYILIVGAMVYSVSTQTEYLRSSTLNNMLSCRAHGGNPIPVYNKSGELVDNLCLVSNDMH